MYTIGNIIYGYPLTRGKAAEMVAEEEFADEPEGFLEFYSGSGDETPAAFGVLIGDLDDCVDYIEMSTLPVVASAETLAEFDKCFSALDQERRDAIVKNDPAGPRVFILWSTS